MKTGLHSLKKQWGDISRSLKMLWQLDRTLLLCNIAVSILNTGIPYVEIFLSAYVLDHLASGLSYRPFMKHVLLLLALILLIRILAAQLQKMIDIRNDACGRRFDMQNGARTLAMDFELLDSPITNEVRARIRKDYEWGAGFYSILWNFPWFLSRLLDLILAVAVLVPLFTSTSLFRDRSALVILIFSLTVILVNILVSRKTQKEVHRLMNIPSIEDSQYTAYYLWGYQSYRQGMDIRLFKGQKLIEDSIRQEEPASRKFNEQFSRAQGGNGLSNGLSAGLLQAAAYLFVALRALAGALSIGSVVKYASVIYRFASALSGTLEAYSEFSLSASRQQSTLDYINIPDVLPKGSIPVEKRGFCDDRDYDYELELRDVSFKYPGSDSWSLRHVSLKLHAGEHLAIVGMNGSGKTTLIKLLCRLYDPTEGTILLNGVDIRKYDYQEYISLFSVVFQDFKLFAFQLGQNVAASADYDREKAISALQKAGLAERLSSLPDGLDTYLYNEFDEGGVEISGGEAQKIALARALYKDAPFVILDEPTAALDPIAEYDIYRRFNELVNQQTPHTDSHSNDTKSAVYISHRLSSCRFCDDIAVFHEGRLIQRGSHEELLADVGNKYFEMWNAQAQYYETT